MSHILFGLGASLSLVNMQGDWLTIHQSEAPRPNDVLIERLYTKKIANIKKMLNTFDRLLIVFESYQFATSLSSLRTSILKIVEGL
jgi:hypothetical protein